MLVNLLSKFAENGPAPGVKCFTLEAYIGNT